MKKVIFSITIALVISLCLILLLMFLGQNNEFIYVNF